MFSTKKMSAQSNAVVNNDAPSIIIIGGGYAGISCAEHLRALGSTAMIRVFALEQFCSRPNLFFRLKFLNQAEDKINYGLLHKDTFYTKHAITLHENENVECINFEQRTITAVHNNTSTQYSYTQIVFATGGIPRYVCPPLVELQDDIQVKPLSQELFHMQKDASSLLKTHLNNDVAAQHMPHNMLVLRNVEEVQGLYHLVK